jgi:predicted O-methyltransferase YrrM
MTVEIYKQFKEMLKDESDIQGHLEFINRESCGIILECGVRDGYSTTALLLGVDNGRGHLFSVDRNNSCERHFPNHKDWTFINAYSTDEKKISEAVLGQGYPVLFDLIFLDTEHTYEIVYQELALWSGHLKPNGKILIHDVTTYHQGAGRACQYFAQREKWDYQIREGWNGLGILKRKEKK